MQINNSWEIDDYLMGIRIKAVKDEKGGHLVITRIDDDPMMEERKYYFDDDGQHTGSTNTGKKS